MSNIGRMRNARLNQARKHADAIQQHLVFLRGHNQHELVERPDAWQDIRNALEQLSQCIHEANAYNNAMGKPK